MYPMYNISDERRHGEEGLNCFMKMLSFSPVHNMQNVHYEDVVSQSCQEMKFRHKTPAAKYDDIDCELDHYQKTAISAYQNGINHCHHIQEPTDYHHQQQPLHQHYRVHHRRNFYSVNSDKTTSLDLYNKNSPTTPNCVQRQRGNGKNNNYHKTDDRNTGDRESSQALESSRLKYFEDDYERNLSKEHYEHYYSYYYNLTPNTSKLSHKQDRGRKLPSTRNMPFQKNSLMSDRSASGEYGNHVLKEKTSNNNKVLPYVHDVWDYDSFKVIGGSGNYAKDMETREFENSKYYDPSSHMHKVKQSTMISHFSPNSDSQDIEKGVNVSNNNYEEVDDHQLSSEEDDESPGKYSAAVSLKKTSSPSKSRRVLIYNSQSPRLSQLISHKRIQRSKAKLQNEPKENNTSQKISESRTRVLKSLSPQRITNRTDGASKTEYKNDKNDSSEESDSELDLDTASDFEVSGDSDISSDSEECYRSHAFKLTHSLDVVSASVSVMSSLNSTESLSNPDTLLVPSLFPNVPPYLSFSSSTKKGPDVPADLYRILKWRVTSVMPRVVRTVLANSGMRLLKKTNDWMGVWGKHMKSPCFKTIRPYQKINHLPGSFKIGRKDSCWKNLVKQMAKHGKKEFGFMPKTYIIPNDLKQLRKSWPKYSQRNVKWIIKPPASARGSGIRVVDRWAQIPKRKSLIVQKYIERPLLINGSKFDLRLYVLVTSIHPLRVYMYHNGLARFASVKYSDKSDTLSDRCMHLTNYSINKFSSNYSKNEDVNACHGHKWTIKSLWNYLAIRGVRTELLWEALRSLVLRTILAGENSINNMIRTNVESKYSCFELFGFDVLLDAELIPWLLEVNISPSLHSELPLDAHVKAPLVQSVLNTALYNIPPKISIERQKEIAVEMSLTPGPICYDKRIYVNYLSRSEKIKHSTYTRKPMEDRDEYIFSILDHLTPDDVRCLIIAEDELARSSPLERIFPTADTHKYLKYTETPRYYNRLLDAWETRYGHNRDEGIAVLRQLCDERYHLQVPQIPTKKGCWRAIVSLYWRCRAFYSRLSGKISKMDFKVIIAAIVSITIASMTTCVISHVFCRYRHAGLREKQRTRHYQSSTHQRY